MRSRSLKTRPFVLFVLPLLVIISAAFVVLTVVTREDSSRGGDPDGRLLRELARQARDSVPPSASIIDEKDLAPVWDSCDGRAGTFGWGPARVILNVRSSAPSPESAASEMNEFLRSTGWLDGNEVAPSHYRWSRPLEDGRMAQVDVFLDRPSMSTELLFTAQPPGPAVGSC